MHRSLSKISSLRHGIWLWMPATVDLNDAKGRSAPGKTRQFSAAVHTLAACLFPAAIRRQCSRRIDSILARDGQTVGGDPSERPRLVSLQGFSEPQVRWSSTISAANRRPGWAVWPASSSRRFRCCARGCRRNIPAPLPRHHPQQTVPVSGVLVGSCLCPDGGGQAINPGPYNTPQSTTGSHPTRTDY